MPDHALPNKIAHQPWLDRGQSSISSEAEWDHDVQVLSTHGLVKHHKVITDNKDGVRSSYRPLSLQLTKKPSLSPVPRPYNKAPPTSDHSISSSSTAPLTKGALRAIDVYTKRKKLFINTSI